MGIPKLFSKVAQYQHLRDGEFFKGGDFYIDGCNFNHSREELFNEKGYLYVFRENLDLLLSLQPNSVTMYYDASFPPSKIPVKMNRIRQKLRGLGWDSGIAINDLALEELKDNYPQINVVITGTEAEDQIYWDLCQKPTPFEREQFVFSSDSDCFTFNVPGMSKIHVVSVKNGDQWPKRFETWRMSEVTRSSAVVNRLHAPPKPLGVTVTNPRMPDTDCQELVNMLKSYGQAIMFLTIVPPNLPDPWEAGLKWRIAAYSVLTQDGIEVDEYRQQYLDVKCHKITASNAHCGELTTLLDGDISELIANELQTQLPADKYSAAEQRVVQQYLDSLKSSDVYNIRSEFPEGEMYDGELYEFCKMVCDLILPLFMSIRLFKSSLEHPAELYRLGWKLNPKELYGHFKQ